MSDRRISERLAGANPLAIAAVVGLRSLGKTRLGKYVGRAWYRSSAERIARELGRIPGLEGVYLLGSTARGDPLMGYSDIDLVLTTSLPTVGAELEFRRSVERIIRRYNRPLERFNHVDYVERRDLELLSSLGDAFVTNFEARWKLIHGSRTPLRSHSPSARHKELSDAKRSLQLWMKLSSTIVSPRETLDTFERARSARRMLQVIVAAWLRMDSHGALPELPSLLEDARGRAPGEAFERLCENPRRGLNVSDPSVVQDLLAAALDVLDAYLGPIVRDFTGKWPSSGSPARVDWHGSVRLAEWARALGFARVEVAARTSSAGGHLALVTTKPHLPARKAIAAVETLTRELEPLPTRTFGRTRYPVLMTPTLRAAAAFIEPFPTAGARLAAGPTWASGEELGPPPAPSEEDLHTLTTIALVKTFWRPRGRALRFTRARDAGLGKMSTELVETLPELLALREGRAVDYGVPGHTEPLGERELLERLHAALDRLRPELFELLEMQRRSESASPRG